MLTEWGRRQQRGFADQEIKKRVLNALTGRAPAEARILRSWPWLRISMVASASAVLVWLVIVGNWTLPGSSPVAVTYQSQADTASLSPSSASKEMAVGDTATDDRSGVASSYEPVAYWPQTDVNYKDSREYLKVYYRANIQTRKVDLIANRAQTTVRGYGGRIDSSSLNQRSAYISFIVPKKSFEAFKTELKSLVGARFITENLDSQNLLPQKVNIEDQTKTASSSLADYQSQKKNLTDKHNQTMAGYQSQISYYSNQVWNAQQELNQTTSTARQAELRSQISSANANWSRIKKLMDSANSDYNKKAAALDSQIKTQQTQLVSLKTQDTNLIDNVETVQGMISVNWISYGGIVQLYVPFYRWLIAGAMLIVILAAVFGRGRSFETV